MTDPTPSQPSALSRFFTWLTNADEAGERPTPATSLAMHYTQNIPPAFGGVPPSVPLGEVEILGQPSRTQDTAMGGALMASARRLTSSDAKGRNENAKGGASKTAPWQDEAWELLDLIGEQRFLAQTLAGRMSQAALYVGKTSHEDSPGTRPEKVNDDELQELLGSIGDGVAGQGQLIRRAGVNLFVAGEVWLVGIPSVLVPGTPEYEQAHDESPSVSSLPVRATDRTAPLDDDNSVDILDLTWRMFSVSEVNVDQQGEATLSMEDGSKIVADADNLYMIRIWRPHPRRAWEADSPTRASLPVLRELLGLTQHISAQVDSRLAGAGLLVVSTEADAALKRAAGIDENDPRSPLMEALTLAMQTAIKDRASASALVPLAVSVPGTPSEAFHHMSFSTPLDKEARQLRDEAIRRLALGQDAPPELLLGTGGMNHWGAWLVREDVVNTHLEPPLALICDALTTQYLRPLMLQLGYSEEELDDYVVWYDVDHLIARPNRTQDAKDLHAEGVISDEALREAVGFEEGAAPEEIVEQEPAIAIVMQMIAQAPSLANEPGIPILVEQIRGVLNGEDAEALPNVGDTDNGTDSDESTEGDIPDTADDPPPAGTPGNPEGNAS